MARRASANRYGLVLQGKHDLVLDTSNTFEGNREDDELVGGALSLPTVPPIVP